MSKPTPTIERRAYTCRELRAEGEGKERRLVGYAAVFDEPTKLFGFTEIVRESAFDRSLKEDADVRALVNHDSAKVIGRRSAKTLKVEVDAKGLRFDVSLPDTSYARDLAESVERGDVDQMSFGFRTRKDRWTFNSETEQNVRELLDVDLIEVSPVTFPAYEGTSVALRTAPGAVPDGYQPEQLAAVIVRATRNLPLSDADVRLLRSTSELLTGLVPAPPAPPSPIARIRAERRLRLAEAD